MMRLPIKRAWPFRPLVYKPSVFGEFTQFVAWFNPKDVEADVLTTLYRGRSPKVKATTKRPPEVIVKDARELYAQLCELDARNLPRDKVFDDYFLWANVEHKPLPEFALKYLRERAGAPECTHYLALRSIEIDGL